MCSNVVGQVDRFAMTLLVTPMQHDLGLNDTQTGLIGGLVTGLFFALAGLPLARLADQFNRTRLVIIGLGVWSLMTAAQGLTIGFWTLCLARLFLTVGEASLGPSSNSLLGNVFPRGRLARPLSVVATGSSLGNAAASALVALFLFVAPYVAPPLSFGGAAMAPWRVVMIGLGLVGLVPMLLLALAGEPVRPAQKGEKPDFRTFVRYVRARWRAYLPCYLGYALFVLPFVALSFWLPTAFERRHGLAPTVTGVWLGIGYLIAAAPGTIFGGWLADRLERGGRADGKLQVLMIATVGAAGATIVSQLLADPKIAMGFVWLAMACAAMGLPPVLAAVQALTVDRFRGQASAVLYLLIFIVAFMGIPVAGALTDDVFKDRNSINLALVALTLVFGTASFVLVWFGRRNYVAGVAAFDPHGR
ncbi:MAG: MFS transporter [Burkholderiales bacterium]|nr:MFS transporter [Burkholderiales bacterium]MDE2503809.1 MFS transporter [Burkholderiales bacterium]